MVPNNSYRIVLTAVLMLCIGSSLLDAQENIPEIVPWEPEDVVPLYAFTDTLKEHAVSPCVYIAMKLIRFYQTDISTKSVSRCPFYISCSNYTMLAVQKYGLMVGICFFIDRNLYRENIASSMHYELRETRTGVLKLDDSYYLFGGKRDKQR